MLKKLLTMKTKGFMSVGSEPSAISVPTDRAKMGQKQGASKRFLRSALRKILDAPQDLEKSKPENWRDFAAVQRRKALKSLAIFAVAIRRYLPSKSSSWVLADRS